MPRLLFLTTFFVYFLAFLGGLWVLPAWAAHGLGMGYEPKYKADFKHFDYVNPAAPKGGKLVLSSNGSFDKLNPFTLKGRVAEGMGASGSGFLFAEYGLLFDTLTAPSEDEPFSRYGLLAQDIVLAPDQLSVTFVLNPLAKFSDGQPVMAADVKHSFDTLMSKQASPVFRSYWGDVKQAVVVEARTVRFDFKRRNSELHMVMGQLPVFSRAWGKGKPFDEVLNEAPIASGPYKIDSVVYGKSISYQRRPDYWAANLPVRKGMYNFDKVSYQYFRDRLGEEESFKVGEFDALEEASLGAWMRRYKGKRFDSGELIKSEIEHQRSTGMQGLVMNQRRDKFKNPDVRQALALAFDFDSLNQRLFYQRRTRTISYFQNTDDLMARDAVSPAERQLASQLIHKSALLPLLDQPVPRPAATGATAEGLRRNLLAAQGLLNRAGWAFKDGALRNSKGDAFVITMDMSDRASEPVLSAYARNLGKLGIDLKLRLGDSSLIKKRFDEFDFDMAVVMLGGSTSPGNELYDDFGSKAALENGSQNMAGLQDPLVDELIEKIVTSPNRSAIATGAKLLDRYLLSKHLGVPMYYGRHYFLAHKAHLAHPDKIPSHLLARGWLLTMWWSGKR
jgi:microcin C transport system substrate-binding protein